MSNIKLKLSDGTELEGSWTEVKEALKILGKSKNSNKAGQELSVPVPEIPLSISEQLSASKQLDTSISPEPIMTEPQVKKRWPIRISSDKKKIAEIIKNTMETSNFARVSDVTKALGNVRRNSRVDKRVKETAKKLGYAIQGFREKGRIYGRPSLYIVKTVATPEKPEFRLPEPREKPKRKKGGPTPKHPDELIAKTLIKHINPKTGVLNMRRALRDLDYGGGGAQYRKFRRILSEYGYKLERISKRKIKAIAPEEILDVDARRTSSKELIRQHMKKHMTDFHWMWHKDLSKKVGYQGGPLYDTIEEVAKEEGYYVGKVKGQNVISKTPVDKTDITKEPQEKAVTYGVSKQIYANFMNRFKHFPETFTTAQVWNLVSPIPRTHPNWKEKSMVNSAIWRIVQKFIKEGKIGIYKKKKAANGKTYYIYRKMPEVPEKPVPLVGEDGLIELFEEYQGFGVEVLMQKKAKDGSRINDVQANILMKWICENLDRVKEITGRDVKVMGNKTGCQVKTMPNGKKEEKKDKASDIFKD